MKTNIFPILSNSLIVYREAIKNISNINFSNSSEVAKKIVQFQNNELPEVLFITSYPPRECGIATYSQDLRTAIQEKFGHSVSLQVCALETNESNFVYPAEVKYTLQTQEEEQYVLLAKKINADKNIKMIFLQHEFGLFGGDYGAGLLIEIYEPFKKTYHHNFSFGIAKSEKAT
ncbi:hypothetical protein [Flavobacterium sp.]|uniref:hypothetical protein n=1 Tax=Flavobacterium sp. TaxID=239 RepID=UPI003BED3BD0